MSKILITTTDILDKIFPLDEKKSINEVVIFHKEKDVVPVGIVKDMLVARQKCVLIHLLQYNTKDELMFRLGTMITKEHVYLISDGIFEIPEWLKLEYDISIDGEKAKGKRQNTKTTKNTGTKSQKKTVPPEVKEFVEVLKKYEIEEGLETLKPIIPKIEEPTKEEIEAITVKDTTSKPKKTRKTEKTNENTIVESTFNESLDDTLTAQEIRELETGLKHNDDSIKEFLKRSGVRASDMSGCAMSDEELGDSILSILEADADKNRVKTELEELFGEENTKTITQWINPQITKLHKIAIGDK